MTPLDRLRIEKAAADCGFEMTPSDRDGGLELRSARFPESVVIRTDAGSAFTVTASNSLLLRDEDDDATATVVGYEALYEVLKSAAGRARTLPNLVADAFRLETAELPRATEAERVVIQRVGQNLFRAALMDYWQGRCCVTGLGLPELLRASHIKPWAACESDEERLDVFNGLLLAPQLDALFDAGWITFGDDGMVCISSRLSREIWPLLALASDMRVSSLNCRHKRYLKHHREVVWKR